MKARKREAKLGRRQAREAESAIDHGNKNGIRNFRDEPPSNSHGSDDGR